MSIPRRIIQTAKTRDLSPLARAAAINLKLLHPDWEYLFFDDHDIRKFIRQDFPEYRTVFETFSRPIQRIDFFRYLAVLKLGGFYFDLDVFLSESLTDLIDHNCVFPFEELSISRHLRRHHGLDWELGNYAFGANADDAFLRAVVENCVKAQKSPEWLTPMMADIPRFLRTEFSVLNSTGPGLVTRTYAENADLHNSVTILFPDDVSDEKNWHQFGSYGVHAMDGSWREKGNFLWRKAALLWENRTRRELYKESLKLGPTRTSGRTNVTC